MKSFNNILFILFFALLTLSVQSCKEDDSSTTLSDSEICVKWANLTTFIMKNTGANSPTYASRTIGYIGLTMYESVVQGYPEYKSLVGQLNGFDQAPNANMSDPLNWRISLNAGQAKILKQMYNQTSDENKAKIDSLESAILRSLSNESNKIVTENSIKFGRAIADQVFEWSLSDGGHRAYLKNFDKEWKHPEFVGCWQPPLFAQSFSHHPLHPNWGRNRTFLKQNSKLDIPEMISYSEDSTSDYYQQFKQVYDKDLTLTQKEKEIALWWGDDPDDTFTPPGHSYYLGMKVIQAKEPDLIKCAETFAKIGLAVADAFINCWNWKYHHFTERANTYIPKFMDESWESFWPDPPFPSFPSGHAINASAAVNVLIDIYGDEFEFTDDSHAGRERDEVRDVDFRARYFTKFSEVAEETANSRFYGGIHIPHDNKVGLEEGKRIAENVNNLEWRK